MSLFSSQDPLKGSSPLFGHGSSPDPLDKSPNSIPANQQAFWLSLKSFKNTLVGENAVDMLMEIKDWVETNKEHVDFLDKYWIIPKITFSKKALQLLSMP